MELKRICRRCELIPLAEEYVRSCRESESRNGKKSYERFPNIAGFARTLGVGVSTLKKIRNLFPDQYGAMLALFEDEALNSTQSASILSAYMKEHLGFGEKKEGGAILGVGDVKLVFEHDITTDGQ